MNVPTKSSINAPSQPAAYVEMSLSMFMLIVRRTEYHPQLDIDKWTQEDRHCGEAKMSNNPPVLELDYQSGNKCHYYLPQLIIYG